jgi:hypothetical protein
MDKFVNTLIECNDYDGLIDFIKKLDEEVDDWDFTMELYDHFKKERMVWINMGNNDGIWRA